MRLNTLFVPALFAAGVAITACSPDTTVDPSPLNPSFLISDGAHSGDPHFYFLPPMVPNPTFSGTFDDTRSPIVQITEDGSLLAELPASIPDGKDFYLATWNTNKFNLHPAKPYRISVLVNDVVLGFADVDVVRTRRQLGNVDTDEYVPLKNGSTLRIKFRIEEGAKIPPFTITNLGYLGNYGVSLARAINDAGQVAGGSLTCASPCVYKQLHAFLWEPSKGMRDLGTIGTNDPSLSRSYATGINGNGVVTGWSETAAGTGMVHAFLWGWHGEHMTDLNALGGGRSEANGINDALQVVGFATTSLNETHAFLWSPSTGSVDLGTLGGDSSVAYAINAIGQVVGSSKTASGENHAFLWSAGTGMTDLGTLDGDAQSVAYGINSAGQVVGASGARAFLWNPGSGMMDLGTLGGASGVAYGINDAGKVVGRSYTSDPASPSHAHAFVWDPTTGMTDLSEYSYRSYAMAYDINNADQIVGHAGESSALLWTLEH